MNKRILIAATLGLTAFSHVQAADATHCLKIEDPDVRLGCYDMEYGKEVSIASTAGDWQLHTDTNPLDDSATHILILESESGTNRWGKPINLLIRCKSNTTNMWINWDDYLGNDSPEVTTRLGSENAKTGRWSKSTNNSSTFYPGSPIGYIQRMMSESRFVAQVTPYNENPSTAVFNITGLKSAIKPLRKNCNW